jgi:hypothetical protein
MARCLACWCIYALSVVLISTAEPDMLLFPAASFQQSNSMSDRNYITDHSTVSYLGPGLDESQSLTPCSVENHYFSEKTYAKDTLDEPKRIAKK